MNRVLIIAAHPDDEVLGAGATIHKMAKEGSDVFVCLMSHRSPTRYDDLIDGIRRSHKILGVTDSMVGDYECMMFSTQNHHSMVSMMESAIKRYKPDTVITHFHGDLHIDHQTVAQCASEAVRLPQRQTGYDCIIHGVYSMEVPSSTDWKDQKTRPFSPNFFVEVGEDDLDAKIEAVSVYDEVLRKEPHPRSMEALKALATLRGSMSGVSAAEAFELRFMVV